MEGGCSGKAKDGGLVDVPLQGVSNWVHIVRMKLLKEISCLHEECQELYALRILHRIRSNYPKLEKKKWVMCQSGYPSVPEQNERGEANPLEGTRSGFIHVNASFERFQDWFEEPLDENDSWFLDLWVRQDILDPRKVVRIEVEEGVRGCYYLDLLHQLKEFLRILLRTNPINIVLLIFPFL